MDYSKLTQAEIKRLAKYYLDSRNRLYETIIKTRGVGTKTYANTVIKQLNKELNKLLKHSTEFINTQIPEEYRAALDDIYGYFRRNRLMMRSPNSFSLLHTDKLYQIQREAQFAIAEGLAAVGRQIQRYVETAMDDTLRRTGLEETMRKEASGGTVNQMAESMLRQMQDEGFFAVKYGDGPTARNVPADVYASMVARSTTREAGNTARITQLTENGYDLVKMSEHYPTCALCAIIQGRVYSISGNDDRFPALYDHWSEEYNNCHPNGRHVIMPWIESMKSPDEVKEALGKAKKPFTDTRDEKERALYSEQQAQNRRWRNEMYQYERYKARLGDDAPKTLAEFKRIKRADGADWKALSRRYIDEGRGLSPGHRMPAYEEVTGENKEYVIQEAQAIGIPPERLRFNSPNAAGTSYSPLDDMIDVKGDVFPRLTEDHPRAKMSVRAALAHEEYGHRPNREQYLWELRNGVLSDAQDWQDEFRASYKASIMGINLSDEDRAYLYSDAKTRAEDKQEFGRMDKLLKELDKYEKTWRRRMRQ